MKSVIGYSLLMISVSLPQVGWSRETQKKMQQIVSQSICLAEGYRGSPVGDDAENISGVYLMSLKPPMKDANLKKLRQLAADEKPGALVPVGDKNFAIAKCILFSLENRVQKLFKSK